MAERRESSATPGTEDDEHGFLPVCVEALMADAAVPVDLYLRHGDPPWFDLFRPSGQVLDRETIRLLRDNEISDVYVPAEECEALGGYLEERLTALPDLADAQQEEAWTAFYGCAGEIMRTVFRDPSSGDHIGRVAKLAPAVIHFVLSSLDPLAAVTARIGLHYHLWTHSVNVCMLLVTNSAELLGIRDERRLTEIALGGLLHDMGKSRLPRDILEKPGQLTDQEFEQVKRHPTWGLEIVRPHLEVREPTRDVIRNHHEHYDGSGYPDGLCGPEVSALVQLATIVDVYDAITTRRAYADAVTPYQALRTMIEEMPGHFGLPLLKEFIQFLGSEGEMRDSRD